MGKNVSRLLRFPGPPNVKDPARPVMTGIDFCRDSMRFDLAYLLEAWPEKRPEKKKRVESHANGDAKPGRSLTEAEKKRILEFWVDGRRRASCLAVAGAMRKAGWIEEDAAAAIAEISELDGGNTTDRLHIVRTTYRDDDLEKIVGWEALRELGVKDGEIPSIEKPLKGRKRRPKSTDLFTDMTNAREFVEDHGDEFRYLRDTLAWMKWDGKRWAPNATVDVELAAITTADRLYNEALDMPTRTVEETVNKDAALDWAKQSQSWRTRQAMIRSAAPQPELACATTMLDQHPDWLNVANGTIDLRTGELMPHKREHLISRLAPISFDPKAEAPMWERFIVDIFQGKPELLMFVQIAIGYTLTGRTNEQCFFLMYGDGSNGKGTFIETIKLLLGDLAQTTPFSTFLVKKNDGGIPADIAMLRGARFVTASEADQNARFSEALIKQLTGQDEVSARFMRENFFKFIPEFKLWLSVNHKPVIRGTDLGIWRRIKLIPFEAKFDGANKDPHLRDKLRLELPGILSWAVTGARLWYQHACLPESESVQAATAEYREESDIVGLFLASDVVVIGEGFRTKSSELFDVWRSWCEKNGFFAGNQTSFGRLMRDKGYASKAGKGANFFAGIARATSSSDQMGENRRYSGEEF
jgi:putative DNA primase/helicase